MPTWGVPGRKAVQKGKLLSENQKGHRRTDGDAKLVDEGKEPVKQGESEQGANKLTWNAQTASGKIHAKSFHLAGKLPANEVLGHECANDKEAKDQGSFIAQDRNQKARIDTGWQFRFRDGWTRQ